MSRLNWKKARRSETEQDRPTEKSPAGPWTHVPRAPVKTWAQMTEDERAAIRAVTTPPKKK
jgi:hypothetical protein